MIDKRALFVPGKPVGKARPRFSRKSGTVYQPKTNTEYEKHVQQTYNALWGGLEPLRGAVTVEMDILYPVAKNDSKKQKQAKLTDVIRPCKKPDIDNVAKIIFDALNGLAYDDDAQIVQTTISKYYVEQSECGVHVTVRGINGTNAD